MPRTAREKSVTGIYHVMIRGINQQVIFNDNEDFEKFLDALKDCKAISGFELYAYCLMNNHVHLLLKVQKEELSLIFKRIGVRYVYWYNWKYSRRGHLFQDRFKSEPVNDEKYFLAVLRYIHQNPLKAGLVNKIETYQYSSYNEYIKLEYNFIIDTNFVLAMLGKKEFVEFHKEISKDECLENEESDFRITDNEAREIIENISNCKNVEQFLSLSVESKEKYIKIFKEKGISYRRISRLTGVSFGVIRRI